MEGSISKPFWEDQTLTWYRRAAAHSSYHRDMAALISPHIPAGASVCDLGCGPGCLSLALLEHIPAVTALDRDPGALGLLRELGAGRNGLTILDADAMAMPPDWHWDCMILSFFGRITIGDHLAYFMSHCDRLISIVNAGPKSSFSATGASARKKEYTPQVAAFLRDNGWHFTVSEHTLEFGQPLTDLADARAFVKRYSPPDVPTTDADLIARLRPLPDGGFYLPNTKRFGLFIIDKEV